MLQKNEVIYFPTYQCIIHLIKGDMLILMIEGLL